MGKPFKNEIQLLPSTYSWANELDLSGLQTLVARFHNPVYIVGSGGSFSACVFAANLLVSKGIFAKAITPLELFYSRHTLHRSNLIFISASGRNTDILFAFKKAVQAEPVSIINICMRTGTKLAGLAGNYSACTSFEFTPPAGKDGFLATNSLVAYFVLLYRAIFPAAAIRVPVQGIAQIAGTFLERITPATTFVLLYGQTNHAVAVDIESKLSEAGLAASLLSDYRHFAHGRHQWFDKKPDSAIIALSSPDDYQLSRKTLELLPDSIPRIVFSTGMPGGEGTIQLLLESMHLIAGIGDRVGIDPGRPGVPDYGSKIYHLRYERLVPSQNPGVREAAVLRKAKVNSLSDLKEGEQTSWKLAYDSFVKKLSAARFGCLIFDYDGTLCSQGNRFNGMPENISRFLIEFVKKGFVLAVVSGRGKSLRTDFEKVFAGHPDLADRVLLGYYNGSDIAPLSNQQHPDKTRPTHPGLKKLEKRLVAIGLSGEPSPNQLTFGSKTTDEWTVLREKILNELMLMDIDELTIVESSHSIDIIPRKIASKNNILAQCRKLCKKSGLPDTVLCVGDKGQWPGNDYALLSNPYALSVGEVSADPETGWNLSPPGLRDEKAVSFLFEKITYKKKHFTIASI